MRILLPLLPLALLASGRVLEPSSRDRTALEGLPI